MTVDNLSVMGVSFKYLGLRAEDISLSHVNPCISTCSGYQIDKKLVIELSCNCRVLTHCNMSLFSVVYMQMQI